MRWPVTPSTWSSTTRPRVRRRYRVRRWPSELPNYRRRLPTQPAHLTPAPQT